MPLSDTYRSLTIPSPGACYIHRCRTRPSGPAFTYKEQTPWQQPNPGGTARSRGSPVFHDPVSHRRRLGAVPIHLVRARRAGRHVLCLARARHRHVVSPAAHAPVLQDAESASNISSPSAPRWRSKAARSSGWRCIASTISTRTATTIRIRRSTAASGRTWAGSCSARRCTTTRR